jgi:hypothetical protein
MFLMEMTNFQQSDDKVHKKIWASMEEMLDAAGDDDIPIDEIRKKNIRIFKAQGKPTKLHACKTNITGKKMSDCSGCPVHCFNFCFCFRFMVPPFYSPAPLFRLSRCPLPFFSFLDSILDQSKSSNVAIFDQFADEKTSPSVLGKSVHLTSQHAIKLFSSIALSVFPQPFDTRHGSR